MHLFRLKYADVATMKTVNEVEWDLVIVRLRSSFAPVAQADDAPTRSGGSRRSFHCVRSKIAIALSSSSRASVLPPSFRVAQKTSVVERILDAADVIEHLF
jgi:hypothetical protein